MKSRLLMLSAGFVGASSLFMTSVAFAATNNSYSSKVVTSSKQTSITLSIPNLNNKLQPAQTLTFVFTLGGPQGSSSASNPKSETGNLTPSPGHPFTYTIPLPNYGQKETVWVSTSYKSNGYQYTSTAGPLVDTLPEAPLAALIPLGMVGLWYANRKRKAKAKLDNVELS
ncbi:hypothetical protein [Alicyclobacillus sp. SO9]|uniref:hypothetical protein n=1 Tax=Alicyclobacillus sp. SO9 TaxID=2665646 RepID=UPI0018E8F460|nr:hypothetical protein [Alicyclobacillus sp. SO9]QQE79322.1 hypothetical protein GI364_02085 [Alicyclobacillus sp. SO9]